MNLQRRGRQGLYIGILLLLVLVGSIPLVGVSVAGEVLNIVQSDQETVEFPAATKKVDNKKIKDQVRTNLPPLLHNFKENRGQLENEEIKYYYASSGFGVGFTPTGVI